MTVGVSSTITVTIEKWSFEEIGKGERYLKYPIEKYPILVPFRSDAYYAGWLHYEAELTPEDADAAHVNSIENRALNTTGTWEVTPLRPGDVKLRLVVTEKQIVPDGFSSKNFSKQIYNAQLPSLVAENSIFESVFNLIAKIFSGLYLGILLSIFGIFILRLIYLQLRPESKEFNKITSLFLENVANIDVEKQRSPYIRRISKSKLNKLTRLFLENVANVEVEKPSAKGTAQ